ncbi:hypothetical protein ACP8HZ_02280 [Francisella noatunensis]
MSVKKKIIILVAVLVLLFCGFIYYISGSNAKQIPGYVSTNIRYISSQESGRLLRLDVSQGEFLEEGQNISD